MTSAPTNRIADGILVINMDSRPERLAEFTKRAAAHSCLAGWQRLPAVAGIKLPGYGVHPWFRGGKRDLCWAGRAGCTLSHRMAIEHARDAGWDTVLILEDDASPPPTFSADIAELVGKLANMPWALCYLCGSKSFGPAMELAPLEHRRAIFRVYGRNSGVGYLLRRQAYDWILDRLPTPENVWPWIVRHRAIDRWYAMNVSGKFPVLSVSPNLVGQDGGFSDIGQRAGADIGVTENATEDTESLSGVGPAAFHIQSALLRARYALRGPVGLAKLALTRLRGF